MIGREITAKDGETDDDDEADALDDADDEECADMVRGSRKAKKMRRR